MNKDQVKGTIDDVAGRAKRQVGEWTGDSKAQVEGLGQQVKGKAEKAWGNTKDAVQSGSEQVKAKAGKAWENTKDEAQKAKDDARQREPIERAREEEDDELEPVHGAGKGTGKTVTPTR